MQITTDNPSATMGRSQWLMLVTLAALWGGSFFFVEIAVRELPPLTIVWLRVGLAACVLWCLLAVMRQAVTLSLPIVLAFLGMGVLNNAIPFSLIVWGQTQIPSGLASILNATTPIFTVLIAHRFLADESLTINKLIGVALGFVGVATMLLPSISQQAGLAVLPQLAVLGAAISYGCAAVFGRRFRRLGVPPLITATGQLTASALLLTPVALVIDKPWQLPTPAWDVTLSLVLLALASTAFAYWLFFRILSSAGATNIALVTLLVPVTAVLLGILVLGESLSLAQCTGMALIIAGLLAIDGRMRIFQRNSR